MQKYVPKKIIKIIPKLLKPPDICQLILWLFTVKPDSSESLIKLLHDP